MIRYTLIAIFLAGMPSVAFAQEMSFAELVTERIIPFIDGYIIQLLYALAFIFFLYGMVKFFFTGGEANRQKGKQFVVWGLLGLVVLFMVWGLVKVLLTTLFPRGDWNQNPRAGLLPPGSRCQNPSQCRSGVCTIRGINTSTCE